jgi:asparagine synthase (glutamine-hydrolysing)
MCGIAGILGIGASYRVDQSELRGMCDVIRHRGPDDDGYHVEGSVGLGMRRLSIIDIAGGHQPMSNEARTLWVVFNGEIYNFRQLRTELEALGHQFLSHSDTEVIVHGYEQWGEECVKRLRGMFGVALWDAREKKLVLMRDWVGIKPLHWYLDDEKLVFGSEIKSILACRGVSREIDRGALDRFLTYEYIPAPSSIFRGIRKLPPGHLLVWKGGQVSVRSYWDFPVEPDQAGKERIDEDECARELLALLRESVKLQMVSDVPLGAFLSGGIDSSSVVALMSEVSDRPVKTFSIGFEEQSYNELAYARLVAERFGTEHHEFVLTPQITDLVDLLTGFLDEPLGDFSIFPTYLVSKMARSHVTVALSGDGGDELFAGYDTYLADRIARRLEALPTVVRRRILPGILRLIPPTEEKKGAVNIAKRFVQGAALPPELMHTRWMTFLTAVDKELLYTPTLREALRGFETAGFILEHGRAKRFADRLTAAQYVDLKTYLPENILTKVDRMSMVTSLEARVPVLDHKIVEFAFRLPAHLRLKGLTTKYLLKKAVAPLLPPEILTKKKQGFSIPIKNWLSGALRPLMTDLLDAERVRRRGWFEPAAVRRLMDEHLAGRENHSHRLWAMMVLELWQQRFSGE